MLQRTLLRLAGAVFLALGIIGIYVPGLPTTPFVLLAAACWTKASPRLHAKLLAHKQFGPILKNWEERRAVPRKAKYLSYITMTASCIMLFVSFPERPYVGITVTLICIANAVWMYRLPDA